MNFYHKIEINLSKRFSKLSISVVIKICEHCNEDSFLTHVRSPISQLCLLSFSQYC